MTDCLFCKIIAKQIPSQGIYEDDVACAFLDIHPNNPGHVLVVPKRHSDGLSDAQQETLQGVILVVQKVARAVTIAMKADGFNLIVNNGVVAGQAVPHLHFHIIPRQPGDGLTHWPGKTYADGEDVAIAEQIRSAL